MASATLYRAVRNLSVSIERDPEEMVQQQLARLKFMLTNLPLRGARVLEFGCGSGLNSAYLAENAEIASVNGFDFSADAVELASSQYPDFTFSVADGCDPNLDIEAGTWDVVFSTEVLEHVPDMPAFLLNIRRHLRLGGTAFITTPNREVFSNGYEPSPINKEHIKESNLAELIQLLDPHFNHFQVFGQRFKEHCHRDQWKADTDHKIEQLKSGARWNRRAPTIMDRVKWRLLPTPKAPYYADDFEITAKLDDALWFCVLAS